VNTFKKITLLSPAIGTGNVGDDFIEMAVRRLLHDDVEYRRFSVRQPLTPADIEVINATDCALLCGTNLYQRDWHSALTPEMLAQIKVPVIPTGIGTSAATTAEVRISAQTQAMIKALHAHCVTGSVRDPHTAAVVRGVGVENFIMTGCPVLFWARGATLPAVRPTKRTRLVITARNWLMHRWPENVDHPVQIQFLRTILDSFPREQMTFVIHEEYDQRLVSLLNIPAEMVFRSEQAADYQRLYTDSANVVLASRLHAGMLAVANGVPTVFVGHDSRTYSFCEMMDLDCIELFSETSALDAVKRLHQIMDGDVTYAARMQPRFRELRLQMTEFLHVNNLPGFGH
jgi:polysaccharide pyruvyl transferase WcaK-like protein